MKRKQYNVWGDAKAEIRGESATLNVSIQKEVGAWLTNPSTAQKKKKKK
jgi:hypothetical protein